MPGPHGPVADAAVAAVDGLPVTVTVLDEDALTEGGYGGILGVGQGSDRPPRLVHLEYSPADADRFVALVGKGITFDTGGLSLKPAASMVGMKYDMCGAATVLAVLRAAAEMALPVRVSAWLCIADNMPSGRATRPGDVLRMLDGTTVEVLNTDAEGRLVLADGLVAASRENPDLIVDVATLTGAITVALGNRHTGVMGDDEAVAEYLAAAERVSELAWQLPLPAHMVDELDSPIADLQNAKIGDPAFQGDDTEARRGLVRDITERQARVNDDPGFLYDVAKIGILPDGRPVEFGTVDDEGGSGADQQFLRAGGQRDRCRVARPGRNGLPVEQGADGRGDRGLHEAARHRDDRPLAAADLDLAGAVAGRVGRGDRLGAVRGGGRGRTAGRSALRRPFASVGGRVQRREVLLAPVVTPEVRHGHRLEAASTIGVADLEQQAGLGQAEAAARQVLGEDADAPRVEAVEGAQALETLNPDRLMPPSAVAESYWALYQQPRSAWTFEQEIRPFGEKW